MALWSGGGEKYNWLYKSRAWRATRAAYLQLHPNCEVCESRGIITAASVVHHLVHIDDDTINDAEIVFGFDNLMAICAKCHFETHHTPKRQTVDFDFDEDGNIIQRAEEAKLARQNEKGNK